MNAIEQLNSLKLPVGAKPGQAILFVDLSKAGSPSDVLRQLSEMGYDPQIRYLELTTGLHVVAVLKDERGLTDRQYESLENEWESLGQHISPSDLNNVVRLWKGLQRQVAVA